MNKAEKQAEVDKLAERMTAAEMAILAEYRGLTVAQVTDLRKQLNSKGVRGKVVKNTLAKLAVNKVLKDAEKTDIEKFLELFNGTSFVILSQEDVVGPAKVAADFAKAHEHFKIKGGWFENKFVDKAGVEAISSLPSKEETLAKLLALINTPATQLLRVMKAPAEQLARLLAAYKDKLGDKQGQA